MSIKRNTTAVVKIDVGISLETIRSIEFLFKKEKNPAYSALLRRKYKRDEIEIKEGTSVDSSFTMLLRLSPEETFDLTVGKVYMDTQVVLNDGTLPNVPIVVIDDIQETLFNEVYKDEHTD